MLARTSFRPLASLLSRRFFSTTLLASPSNPKGRIVIVECEGGSDKGEDGHRRDTIPIANAIIEQGWGAEVVYYKDDLRADLTEKLSKVDGVIGRVNPALPGVYPGATQKLYETMMAELSDKGVVPMSHPRVIERMGAKDALVKIKDMSCGLSDTFAYYDIPSFKENFPKTIATGTRVLKQNRGSQGEGIWVVDKLEGGKVKAVEAVDNHEEVKDVDEFMTFCEQYIVGENGQLIDQRFLPRIVEGEIRMLMIYDTPTEIVHKKPAPGGISATLKSGAKYVSYQPDDTLFADMMTAFKADLPKIMPSVGMSDQPLPLLWTVDFLLGDKTAEGKDTYYVGEFNCSCVGITQQLNLAPNVAKAAINIVESTKKVQAA